MSSDTTENGSTDPWAPETLRSLLPGSLGSEGTRAAICAIRNPDANAVQIAEKTGLASSYTVGNALRSLLVGTTDQEPGAGGKEMYELRGEAREAQEYSELTEKQRAVIDFAAEHPHFVDEHSYGEVSQAIHEKQGVGVGETYVGRVMRDYAEILHRQRALAASEGDSEAELEDVTTDLTVREMLEAAGYDLPDENLDSMPEVEVDIPEGDGRQATLGEAQEAEAGFERASEQEKREGSRETGQVQQQEAEDDEQDTGSTWLDEQYREAHGGIPGAAQAVRLPDDADDDMVKPNTAYWSYVNGVAPYGVFVSLTNPAYGDDVSGLVAEERLYGKKDSLERGDPLIVELDHRNAKGLAFTDWRHAHPDEAAAAPDSEAEDHEAQAAEDEQEQDDEQDVPETSEDWAERDEYLAHLLGRIEDLERGVNTLREDAVFASEVGEFAQEVEGRLDEMQEALDDTEDELFDRLQNSVGQATVDQAEAAEQKADTLQQMVNRLAERVEQATSVGGTLGRVQEDVQRLAGEGGTATSYSYQRQDGTVTLHLQVDVGGAEAERRPECHECGSPLPEDWDDADGQPPDCPHCGENPLPPVGSSEDSDGERRRIVKEDQA